MDDTYTPRDVLRLASLAKVSDQLHCWSSSKSLMKVVIHYQSSSWLHRHLSESQLQSTTLEKNKKIIKKREKKKGHKKTQKKKREKKF